MKILIVGSHKIWAIERFYIEYLKQFGAEVHLYPAPDIIFDNHSQNILNKILFKTGLRTGFKEVNLELLERVRSVAPDIIWIWKGMEIYPSTLEQLGKENILVNYNPDHPFIIAGPGSGNENVRNSVGLYHLHFCYNQALRKKIEQEYRKPTVFLPFGFELKEEDYFSARQEPELNRVCFIGNPDKIRERTMLLVADRQFPVEVYGNGWGKTDLRNRRNVTIYNAVYGPEFWKRLYAYRIQMNIFREHNYGSHNMRSFEIPAVGGIQVAPYSEEHASFFAEGKEIFYYRNQDQMLTLLREVLDYSVEDASRIRKAARARSVGSAYSYRDRALIVYRTFQRMIDHG
jgi:hypothetical protein